MKLRLQHLVLGICVGISVLPRASSGGLSLALRTPSPSPTPRGELDIRIGAAYVEGERGLFADDGTQRSYWNAPAFDIAIGVSDNAEVLLGYSWITLTPENEPTRHGTGDLKVTALYNAFDETWLWPECSFVIGVKFPNADDDKQLGTDMTDLWFGGIFAKRFSRVAILLDLQIGILGRRGFEATDQDDVLMCGVGAACSLTDWLTIGCEIRGTTLSRFGNDRATFNAGIAAETRYCTLDVGAEYGLGDASADFSATTGLTFEFPFGRSRRDRL